MINKEHFKRTVYTDRIPLSFSCPSCLNGHLKIKAKDITTRRVRETSDSAQEAMRFVVISICDICKEPVTISGTAEYYSKLGHKVSPKYFWEKIIGFLPKHFYPPINIFLISKFCPPNIKACIKKAFSHYWYDLSASANSIRTAVELIMDEQGIPDNTLHARIESYEAKNTECATKLMAVKWIGNAGSHSSEISQDDILDGFDLIHFVIDTLYDRPNRDKHLDQLSTVINTNKGLSKNI